MLVLALALVAAVVVAGVLLLDRGGSGPQTAQPSASPSSAGGATGASRSSSRPRGVAAQAAFLRRYFSVAPGGSDRAWAQLGPREQQVGRASYDRFWGAIASADVSEVQPAGRPGSVEATIRYRYRDGRVVVERQRLTLLRSNGGYLIDGDEVLSSRTVTR